VHVIETCTVEERLPSAQEYNWLRSLVGWGTYEESVIEAALPQSLYCICALLDGQLVGMARIIGDGGMVYYIQDVIVVPACQRQGIGTQMMARIMAYVRAHAHHNSIVGLMAAKGKDAFYAKYGFTYRPNDQMGPGMTMYWSKAPAP
jgi:GNAT superfamily N-acetyltransferase